MSQPRGNAVLVFACSTSRVNLQSGAQNRKRTRLVRKKQLQRLRLRLKPCRHKHLRRGTGACLPSRPCNIPTRRLSPPPPPEKYRGTPVKAAPLPNSHSVNSALNTIPQSYPAAAKLPTDLLLARLSPLVSWPPATSVTFTPNPPFPGPPLPAWPPLSISSSSLSVHDVVRSPHRGEEHEELHALRRRLLPELRSLPVRLRLVSRRYRAVFFWGGSTRWVRVTCMLVQGYRL